MLKRWDSLQQLKYVFYDCIGERVDERHVNEADNLPNGSCCRRSYQRLVRTRNLCQLCLFACFHLHLRYLLRQPEEQPPLDVHPSPRDVSRWGKHAHDHGPGPLVGDATPLDRNDSGKPGVFGGTD